jgi:hypothetical protein
MGLWLARGNENQSRRHPREACPRESGERGSTLATRWIRAPRFRGDKLRGNDGAC